MGASELVVIVLAALILFGGKRVPELARSWGKTMRDMQRAWSEIKRQIGLDAIDDARPTSPKPPTVKPPDTREP